MPLIKGDGFVENLFTMLADGEEAPAGKPIIVSLKRWQAEGEQLAKRTTAVGVRLTSDQAPDLLGDDIHRLAVIALEFPKFRDGRGYSWARMARQRLGYKGEIRAVGDVLRDQWLFMRRCGIDAFEVKPGTRIEDFRAAQAELTVFYQRSSDAVINVLALRHNRGASTRGSRGLAHAAE